MLKKPSKYKDGLFAVIILTAKGRWKIITHHRRWFYKMSIWSSVKFSWRAATCLKQKKKIDYRFKTIKKQGWIVKILNLHMAYRCSVSILPLTSWECLVCRNILLINCLVFPNRLGWLLFQDEALLASCMPFPLAEILFPALPIWLMSACPLQSSIKECSLLRRVGAISHSSQLCVQ